MSLKPQPTGPVPAETARVSHLGKAPTLAALSGRVSESERV